MSAVLLDTNAFAMALTDDPRLPERARGLMLAAERVTLSVISFYEIGQKLGLGKWPAMAAHATSLETRARADGFDLLPLTAAAALEASLMSWIHRDPFDRMIATIAQREALPLISSDNSFDTLPIERIWA